MQAQWAESRGMWAKSRGMKAQWAESGGMKAQGASAKNSNKWYGQEQPGAQGCLEELVTDPKCEPAVPDLELPKPDGKEYCEPGQRERREGPSAPS